MEQVSQNVWVETKYFGANLGIIKTSLGLFLVDTPMDPSDHAPFLKEIQGLGPVAWIVVTDHHLDHFLGASFLPGTILSHSKVKGKFLPTFGPLEKIAERVSWSDPMGAQQIMDLKVKEPSLTFEDRLSFYLEKMEIHLETFPGHTPHTLAVRVEPDGVLFTGDNVVLNAPPFFHETPDPRHWIESLKKMKALPFQILVPGHGPLADRQALDTMTQSIENVILKVRKALNQGMTEEDIREKICYLLDFPSGVKNSAQKIFHRQLEKKGIGQLLTALKQVENS